MPCKRYWDALKKVNTVDGYCPLMEKQLCLHLNVEYFPTLECQRAYLNGDAERDPELMAKELEELKRNRLEVWGE